MAHVFVDKLMLAEQGATFVQLSRRRQITKNQQIRGFNKIGVGGQNFYGIAAVIEASPSI
jgi:hypothetical protein